MNAREQYLEEAGSIVKSKDMSDPKKLSLILVHTSMVMGAVPEEIQKLPTIATCGKMIAFALSTFNDLMDIQVETKSLQKDSLSQVRIHSKASTCLGKIMGNIVGMTSIVVDMLDAHGEDVPLLQEVNHE